MQAPPLHLEVPPINELDEAPDMVISDGETEYGCESARLAAFSPMFNRALCCDPTITDLKYDRVDPNLEAVVKWIRGESEEVTDKNLESFQHAAIFFQSPRLCAAVAQHGSDPTYANALQSLMRRSVPAMLLVRSADVVAHAVSNKISGIEDLWNLPIESLQLVFESPRWDHSHEDWVFEAILEASKTRPELTWLIGFVNFAERGANLQKIKELDSSYVAGAIWMQLRKQVEKYNTS